ncbi:hypothetical protein [Synechococcus sp. CBW1004]|uniref:hypothetical protein n=1 Tax=Synechococcus sp. CBW1004 TaxID=1353136 RepID=UPI0018CD12B8|nr:hypothetical protein [Synechococcus sp. CBW1004]QPN61986.1 hypothetical protein H8F25_09255 [Synechococcus sp. CBW1004]
MLSAWLPDGHGHLTYAGSCDSDDCLDAFFEETCKGCDFYFQDYSDSDIDYEDGNGNPATSITYKSRCRCYEDGINWVSFPCPAGHDDPQDMSAPDVIDGPLPPMVYAIQLDPIRGRRLSDQAAMQAVDPSSRWLSALYESLNVFSHGAICWGQNDELPESLPEIVDTYAATPANGDLLKPSDYLANCRNVRSSRCTNPIGGCVIDAGFDAALLVSSQHQPAAYLLLRGSGFPAEDGVIAVGLHRHVLLEQDGQQLAGFLTAASDGRCWFVLPHPDHTGDTRLQFQALLLAQIPDPHSLPCSLTPPSSSVLAALAAS